MKNNFVRNMNQKNKEVLPILAKILLKDPDACCACCENCRNEIIETSDPDWCIYRKYQPNILNEKQLCENYEKEDVFDWK